MSMKSLELKLDREAKKKKLIWNGHWELLLGEKQEARESVFSPDVR